MNSLRDKYQLVVGLEVHAQLSTKSKAYCGDSTIYGSAPNSQTSPITWLYSPLRLYACIVLLFSRNLSSMTLINQSLA